MTSTAEVIGNLLKILAILVGTFWAFSFLMSCIFVFYEAYTDFKQLLRDDTWLRGQCVTPKFYSELRRHADLCDNALRNATRSPFMVGLKAVADTANPCGRRPCVDTLKDLGWPVLAAVFVSAIIVSMIFPRGARSSVSMIPRYQPLKEV